MVTNPVSTFLFQRWFGAACRACRACRPAALRGDLRRPVVNPYPSPSDGVAQSLCWVVEIVQRVEAARCPAARPFDHKMGRVQRTLDGFCTSRQTIALIFGLIAQSGDAPALRNVPLRGQVVLATDCDDAFLPDLRHLVLTFCLRSHGFSILRRRSHPAAELSRGQNAALGSATDGEFVRHASRRPSRKS